MDQIIYLEEEEDLQKQVEIDAALQKMGKKFTAGYIADRYGVPLVAGDPGGVDADADGDADAETPETVLKPSAAPAAAPPLTMNPQFSESGPQQQAHREMKEFDRIFASLKDDATQVYRKRVGEIASAVVPVERT